MGRRAFVALGGNLGDRGAHLAAARAALDATDGVELVAASSEHETDPVGGPGGQGPFLNAVVELSVELGPRALLERLLAIEAARGRDRAREERWGPRTLDLDLLWMEGVDLREPDLVVPHPRLTSRAFVLAPLAELAPELEVGGRSVAAHLAALGAGAGEGA